MSHYRGPRFKKIRRLRALPGLTSKWPNKWPKPRIFRLTRSRFGKNKKPLYIIRLREKQKLRFHYGLTERQLLKYVRIAGKAKGPTGSVLLQLLEMRLDNTLFRLGMALTIPGARQLVTHRHVLVNGRIIDIPSYRCKPRDIITVRDEQKSRALIQNSFDSLHRRKNSFDSLRRRKKFRFKLPYHLTIDRNKYKGLVNKIIDSKWVGLKINESRVIEYYSRQI